MSCPGCNSDSHLLKIYWKLDSNLVFNMEINSSSEDHIKLKHKEIVHYVLNKYLDGKYSKNEILQFIKDEELFCEKKCNNCHKIFVENTNSTYAPYFVDYPCILEEIFEDDYRKQFVKLFRIDNEKILRLYADDKIDTLHIFFDINDPQNIRLFKAHDIWYSMPWEKGGGEGGIFDVNIMAIILGIVSAFLYDVIKVGYKKAYKKLKKSFLKNIIKLKIPKSSIKKHLQNENIRYNEQMLQKIIEEETMKIVDRYIMEMEK